MKLPEPVMVPKRTLHYVRKLKELVRKKYPQAIIERGYRVYGPEGPYPFVTFWALEELCEEVSRFVH